MGSITAPQFRMVFDHIEVKFACVKLKLFSLVFVRRAQL
jgi:hypothetical protein